MSVNLLDMGRVKVRLIIFSDLDRKFYYTAYLSTFNVMGFYMSKFFFRTLHWSDGILVLQLLNTHLDIYKDFLKLNIAHTTQITAASMYFTTPYVISVY